MKHWVFDPRVGDAVQSSNPALILGFLGTQTGMPVDWQSVAVQAGYYDELIIVHGWRFDPETGFWYGRCSLQ